MVDVKISDLTPLATPGDADLLEIVDMSGTPTTKSVTVEDLRGTVGVLVFDEARRASSNITLNSTSWANVDTGLDLSIPAAVGDVVQINLAALVNLENVALELDAVSVVGGSPVNSWQTDGTPGEGPWYGGPGVYASLGGSLTKTLVSGDLSGGTLTLRLRYKTASGTNKTLFASSSRPLVWSCQILSGGGSGGAWTTYTPTLTQSGAVTKTVTRAKYVQIGKTVHVDVFLTCTGAGSANNVITITLPVTAAYSDSTIGSGRVYDDSAGFVYRGVVVQINTTTVRIEGASSSVGNGLGASGTPFTAALASPDVVTFSCTYEAA